MVSSAIRTRPPGPQLPSASRTRVRDPSGAAMPLLVLQHVRAMLRRGGRDAMHLKVPPTIAGGDRQFGMQSQFTPSANGAARGMRIAETRAHTPSRRTACVHSAASVSAPSARRSRPSEVPRSVFPDHSARSALTGSTRLARRAGT
jgi:hypothetical protein